MQRCGARGKQLDLVVADHVRRHEIDRVAEGPQQQLALERRARRTCARTRGSPVSTSNAQIIPVLRKFLHAGVLRDAGARPR